MSEKPTTGEITQANKEILQAIATDESLFADYLSVLAEHTGRDRRRLADGTWENLDNQSALNCAAIQASSYEDTREVMIESEWKKAFPDGAVREGGRASPWSSHPRPASTTGSTTSIRPPLWRTFPRATTATSPRT